MMTASEIGIRLGLKKHPRSWRGRCPVCDYPGTFSVRAGAGGRPLLFCASCRDSEALVDAVARASGGECTREPRGKQGELIIRQRKQDTALRLWRGAEPAAGTLADHYLARRGLPEFATSSALRFRGDTPHPEYPRLPAMIALVSDATDAPIGIHRTYLSRDGSKANVDPAKASLGPVWGGAIRLDALVPDTLLVIGEGIESSASAGRLMGLPAWAAINAGNLAKGLELPLEVQRVVIAADADEAGRSAARDAWLRWRAEGRTVQIATPDGAGDFNDLLRGVGHD